MITTIPSCLAPVYVPASIDAVPPKLLRDTVFMPSSVAARLLGNAEPATRPVRGTTDD